MQYSTPGRSNLKISRIGFGCMSLRNERSGIPVIHAALDLGINFFDTADIYDDGRNESLVGKALKNVREKSIIATKVGNQLRKDGSGWDWNPTKEYILTAAEQSLKRLATDYIDLYQLHGGTINDPIDETIEAFEILKQQGKIRFYGISSIRPNVIREYVKRSSIVSVMMQYSLLDRRPEENILPLLIENNIGVLCRGALAQGLLVDKPAKEYLGQSVQDVEKASHAISALSGAARSKAQTALRYVLDHPAISSAVTGIRTIAQLTDVVAAADAPALTIKETDRLKQETTAITYKDHR